MPAEMLSTVRVQIFQSADSASLAPDHNTTLHAPFTERLVTRSASLLT